MTHYVFVYLVVSLGNVIHFYLFIKPSALFNCISNGMSYWFFAIIIPFSTKVCFTLTNYVNLLFQYCRSWLVDARTIARKVKTSSLPLVHQIKDCGATRDCPQCHSRIDNSDVRNPTKFPIFLLSATLIFCKYKK